MNKRFSAKRRRPSVRITLNRAARLHQLLVYLAAEPRPRESILEEMNLALRTLYRELELLRRCGIKIPYKDKKYRLATSFQAAEGNLPFPDPQLSFAEMAELARHPGDAAQRLAELLASVMRGPHSGS